MKKLFKTAKNGMTKVWDESGYSFYFDSNAEEWLKAGYTELNENQTVLKRYDEKDGISYKTITI